MANVKQFPESEFPTIHCTRLIVNPDTTDLKWNPSRRHPGINILGKSNVKGETILFSDSWQMGDNDFITIKNK